MEVGEHIAEAVVRELHEEMRLQVVPVRRLWISTAPSGCVLHWIHARITANARPDPNPREVASWQWMSPQQLAQHPEVLHSNREFLLACSRGEVPLPV